MSDQIYTGRDGQKYGPFSKEQVIEMIQAGQVVATDSAWYEGLPEWHPITSFPDFAPYFQAQAQPQVQAQPQQVQPQAYSGQVHPTAAHQTQPLARNPALSTRLGRKLQRAAQPTLASRGARLGAAVLDGLIVFLPVFVVAAIEPSSLVDVSVSGPEVGAEEFPPPREEMTPLQLAATIGFLALGVVQIILLCMRGQTMGKMIVGVRIVRTSGEPAGFVHAFLIRSFCNGLICGIPLLGLLYSIVDICFIFRQDRRCIHDLMAGTVVVTTR